MHIRDVSYLPIKCVTQHIVLGLKKRNLNRIVERRFEDHPNGDRWGWDNILRISHKGFTAESGGPPFSKRIGRGRRRKRGKRRGRVGFLHNRQIQVFHIFVIFFSGTVGLRSGIYRSGIYRTLARQDTLCSTGHANSYRLNSYRKTRTKKLVPNPNVKFVSNTKILPGALFTYI